LDDFVASLHRLAALDPALVLPAHGRPYREAAERVTYLEEHHRRRKDQILEITSSREMTAWEVALEVWGERGHVYERRLALQEGLAHLQSLAVEGRLEKLATSERAHALSGADRPRQLDNPAQRALPGPHALGRRDLSRLDREHGLDLEDRAHQSAGATDAAAASQVLERLDPEIDVGPPPDPL